MIKQALKYTPEELEQIKNKKNSRDFNSDSWSDDDLSNIKTRIKEHYLDEQKTTCPYCKRNLKTRHGRNWDIEHIIPRATVANFMFEPLNLCMSCIDCNGAKSNKKVTKSRAQVKYPTKPNDFLIIHPHIDDYEEHILVIKAGFYYISVGPKGPKTMDTCNLNRFYEFAGYGEDVDNDNEIAWLSNQLLNITDTKIRQKTLLKIAELSLKAAVTNAN